MARIVSASALIIMLGPLRVVVEALTACSLSHHCSTIFVCDVEEVWVVECVENSFQFDAVGCVGTYIGHENSCREVFCVSRGYYPCSSCHLFV